MGDTADQLYRNYGEAKAYAAKIGRPQPHFRDQDKGGYLHTMTCSTQIGWQGEVSGTNYWTDKNFDIALASAIRDNFAMLRDAALAKMRAIADEELLREEAGLRERLLRIEAIKAESSERSQPHD